jgi:hypothetical protein
MEFKVTQEINWEEQFKIMKRWYYRLRGNDDILGLGGSRSINQEDFYYAFFIFCYHIKDGLIKSGILDVEDFINNNLYLQLAGDIANFSKHTFLEKTRTGDLGTKAFRRGYVVNLTGPGPSSVLFKLEIVSNGKTYDSFEVVEECMNAWYQFLTLKSLPIPEIIEENIYQYFIKWEPKKS